MYTIEVFIRSNKYLNTIDLFLPVIIHTQTTHIEMLTLSSSAEVKRPQTPRDILCLFAQGLQYKLILLS